MRIAFDRLPEQVERPKMPFFSNASSARGAQVEVEGRQVVSRSVGRAADFRCLQGRLDDAGDADRHIVLKLENVFQGTVESVSPEIRSRRSVDQLRG